MDLTDERFVLTTTNGTRALSYMECGTIIAASFLNLSAVLRTLFDEKDVDIVCAGTEGEFSLEDFLLAGFIVNGLGVETNDAGTVASSYARSVSDIEEEIRKSSHAKRLIDLGFEKDVEFCSKMDLFEVVPIMKNGEFVNP